MTVVIFFVLKSSRNLTRSFGPLLNGTFQTDLASLRSNTIVLCHIDRSLRVLSQIEDEKQDMDLFQSLLLTKENFSKLSCRF